MNFAKVKSITIPEGVVQRILRGSEVLWSKSVLPSEYQRVEWIGATGTQWINTGVSPQSDDVVWECEWLETELEYKSCIFASTNESFDSTLRNRFSGNHYHVQKGELGISLARTTNICRLPLEAGVKNTLRTVVNNGTVTHTLNGNSASGTYAGTIKNEWPIGLFATNRTTTMTEWCYYTRMYSWKMTDNGVVVRDMIPCYRKADGVIGMYDTVSKQFFTNAGTGEFTKGEDV